MKKVLIFTLELFQVEVDDGLVAVHCSHGLHRWEDSELIMGKTVVKLVAIHPLVA